MTKSELIHRIATRFPALTGADANTAVSLILERMTSCIVSGQRIEIRGFGSFTLNYRLPRVARNPMTGARVAVPGKHVPHFKAGKALRDRIVATVAAATEPSKHTLDE